MLTWLVFEPDIAGSNSGEHLSGSPERFEGWFWNKLARLLQSETAVRASHLIGCPGSRSN